MLKCPTINVNIILIVLILKRKFSFYFCMRQFVTILYRWHYLCLRCRRNVFFTRKNNVLSLTSTWLETYNLYNIFYLHFPSNLPLQTKQWYAKSLYLSRPLFLRSYDCINRNSIKFFYCRKRDKKCFLFPRTKHLSSQSGKNLTTVTFQRTTMIIKIMHASTTNFISNCNFGNTNVGMIPM